MEELYQHFLDGEDVHVEQDSDPFWDPVEVIHLGSAHIWLQSLAYCMKLEEQTELLNFEGQEEAIVLINVVPCSSDGRFKFPFSFFIFLIQFRKLCWYVWLETEGKNTEQDRKMMESKGVNESRIWLKGFKRMGGGNTIWQDHVSPVSYDVPEVAMLWRNSPWELEVPWTVTKVPLCLSENIALPDSRRSCFHPSLPDGDGFLQGRSALPGD